MNKALIMLLSLLTAHLTYAEDATLSKYQYWFDDNHQNLVEGALSGDKTETLELALDVGDIGLGLHTLHIRVADNEGVWSSPLSWLFLSEPKAVVKTPSKLEYWMDQSFDNRKSLTMDSTVISFAADASPLTEGMHTISYRVQDSEGAWSTLSQWAFYKTNVLPADSIDKIEYWIDSNTNLRKSINATSGYNVFVVQADTLREGIHTLSYRTRTNLGRYSSTDTWSFYKTTVTPLDSIYSIEYWVDTCYTERNIVPAVGGTNTFSVNTKGMKEGVHTLSYRARSDRGFYSAAGVWMFYKTSEIPKASGVKWYKYWWNDREDLAIREELDSIVTTYTLNQKLKIPDYARAGYNGKPLTARLFFVFGDNVGNVSNVTYSDIIFPDINPPVSEIEADKRMAYTSVTLSWSATDEELKDYNIYVSENDLPYVLWLPNTASTSAEFFGESGKSYRFTVTARDKSDNVERFDEEKYVKVIFSE